MQERRGLPGQLPSAFVALHPSLAADSTVPDPRLLWDPSRLHLQSQIASGLSPASSGLSAAVAAELSLLQRSADLQAVAALRAHQQAHYDLYGAPTPPFRGLSPLETARGLASHEYLATMSTLGQRSMADYHASASLVGSDLSLNLDGSRLSLSPRHGLKRPLSSALSDSFDLGSMIRFSPTSLVPLPVLNGSRCSSASGSYGHMSAGTGVLSPALGMSPGVGPAHLQQLQAHLLARGSPYLTAQAHSAAVAAAAASASPFGTTHPLLAAAAAAGGGSMPPYTGLQLSMKEEQPKVSPDTSTQEEKTSNAANPVSSSMSTCVTATPEARLEAVTVKREASSTSAVMAERPDEEPPEDFIVTHCDWQRCGKDFDSQAELVKHVNSEHISCNKKSFSCLWRDCPRQQRPFKAQYMLVVHVRTHTGDKPNKCSFEGCNKRYSRLENLKTHLRSHTGEKPYACEFPGCCKAFSNASDRAKHQNRTHSNEKPYVCKVPGCTKRYTDPSSLRKHVKTVHGPEFYKNKRHKGVGDESFGPGSGPGGHPPADSPSTGLGDEFKVGSVTSPSMRSEEAVGSPGSPASRFGPGSVGAGSGGAGLSDGAAPPGGHRASPGQGGFRGRGAVNGRPGGVMESYWEVPAPVEPEVVQIPAGVVAGDGYPCGSAPGYPARMYRPRIPAKAGFFPQGGNVSDINYRMQHLRMGGAGVSEADSGAGGVLYPGASDLPYMARRHSADPHFQQDQSRVLTPHHQHHQQLTGDPRRDSAATYSTYYGSMSCASRRASQLSTTAAGLAQVAGGRTPGVTCFDPASGDASRRCSQLSTASSGAFSGTCVAGSAGPMSVSPAARMMSRRYNEHHHQQQQAQYILPDMAAQTQQTNMALLSSASRNVACGSPSAGLQQMSHATLGLHNNVPNAHHPTHQQQLRRASDPVFPMHRHSGCQSQQQFYPGPTPQGRAPERRPSALQQLYPGSSQQGRVVERRPSALQQVCEEPPLEEVLDYLQQASVAPDSGATPVSARNGEAVGPVPGVSPAAPLGGSSSHPAPPVYGAYPPAAGGPSYPSHAVPGSATTFEQLEQRSPAAGAPAPYSGGAPYLSTARHVCGHPAVEGQQLQLPCPPCCSNQQLWGSCQPPSAAGSPPGRQYMSSDRYSRTLQYVQRCSQWSESPPLQRPLAEEDASEVSPQDSASNVVPAPSSNHPVSGNLVVHSMRTAINTLAHENTYLNM